MESKKYSKLENKAKKESDSENKLVVTSGERGRGERQYRGKGLRGTNYYIK